MGDCDDTTPRVENMSIRAAARPEQSATASIAVARKEVRLQRSVLSLRLSRGRIPCRLRKLPP